MRIRDAITKTLDDQEGRAKLLEERRRQAEEMDTAAKKRKATLKALKALGSLTVDTRTSQRINADLPKAIRPRPEESVPVRPASAPPRISILRRDVDKPSDSSQ